MKPARTCLCAHVRPFRTAFSLVLLQHPWERKRSVGTARITHLCVQGSRIIQGENFDESEEVARLIADPSNDCRVLYPGPRSVNVGAPGWSPPTERRLVVFVIDGTWTTAKRMFRLSTCLQSLPQIRFDPETPSEYRFRKQPAAICLSTLEAVHRLIGALEPKTDADNLMHVFRTMVAAQVAFGELGVVRTDGPR